MIQPKTKEFLSNKANFVNNEGTLDFTVGDFWQWAFSDLQQNNIRGILSEFIVAKALSVPLGIRHTWDDFDLKTSDGIKIEIKSGAYLQSWQQNKLFKIIFGCLCGQEWNQEERNRSGSAKYRANIYIFAVQTAETHDEFRQLDIGQWEFYVLPKTELEKRNKKSNSLAAIKKITDPVCFRNLKEKVKSFKQINAV